MVRFFLAFCVDFESVVCQFTAMVGQFLSLRVE